MEFLDSELVNMCSLYEKKYLIFAAFCDCF